MKRYFSTLCGIHCSLNLLISYTKVCIMSGVSCMLKETSKPSYGQVTKKRVICTISLCWIQMSSFANIRDPVVCVLCIPRFLAILHQTHQNICWGDDEALPMNRQFQRSKPRNRRLSKWGTPKTFLLKMVSRSCKWICFGAMDFETHPSFADCADSPEAAECWICTDHPGYQVFG